MKKVCISVKFEIPFDTEQDEKDFLEIGLEKFTENLRDIFTDSLGIEPENVKEYSVTLEGDD